MRAMAIPSYGPVEQMKLIELPTPEPGASQVRVKVHSSAVNPSELKVATGATKFLHGRNFPMVLGYDFSGVVDRVGAGVATVAEGDEVFGFLPYSGSNRLGAFAEYTVSAASGLTRKPAGVSHTVAAAAATPAITALQSLRDLGRLPSYGHTLIIGASGGVGALGVGVAKKLGADVVAVVATHAVHFVKGLGADSVIDRKREDPPRVANGPFDVVFDAAAASSWSATRHLLGKRGVYVTTLPGAAIVLQLGLSLLTTTRAKIVIVRNRADDLALLGRWLTEGLQVPIDSTVPVRDVVAGIKRMAAGEMRGRISVDVIGGFDE
jgi:NADPH:quinone reductase-like Zn-dependent oxidoreductase